MGEKARRFCADVILVSLTALIAVFLLKNCFFLLFPVGMGYLFSEAVRGSFRKLRPVSAPVKRVLIILLLMILFAFMFLLVTLAAEKTLAGIRALTDGLAGAAEGLSAWTQKIAGRLSPHLTGILGQEAEQSLTELLPELLREGARRLAQRLPDLVAAIAGGMPSFFLSLILFLFCGYFFSCGWDRTRALFYRLCPEEHRPAVLRRKAAFLRAFKKILGAYSLLFLLTFSELLLGFFILKIPGAASMALTVALVDALPIFGCGTVLVPWSVVLLLRGSVKQGAGMLALYGLIFVVRQFLEPRIVGRSIGLSPVFSLVLMLAGLKLFGVWGMFLLPLFAACLWSEKRGAET